MTRLLRSVIVILILAVSVAALPCVGLLFRPLRVTALRLSPQVYQPTAAATPTRTEESKPIPTSTPALTESHTAALTSTPTVTPTTAPSDIVVTGQVYDARFSPIRGVQGAVVSVLLSVPRRFSSLPTGPDGAYSLFVPSIYAELIIHINVWAGCYQGLSFPITPFELRAEPQRDFALSRSGECDALFPIVVRQGFPIITW